MLLRPTYPVLTDRLALRPFTVEDVDAMLAYRGRADVCRYLPFEPRIGPPCSSVSRARPCPGRI